MTNWTKETVIPLVMRSYSLSWESATFVVALAMKYCEHRRIKNPTSELMDAFVHGYIGGCVYERLVNHSPYN